MDGQSQPPSFDNGRAMKHIVLAASLLSPMLASAQVPHVLGDFAYKFTEENRAIFTVRSSGAKLNLVLNLNGKVVKVAALSKARRKFGMH